jgi:hypothetical protein
MRRTYPYANADAGLRRSDTISSSLVASVDEPSTTPFGPGERRTGDAVVTEPVDTDVVEGGEVIPLVLGCAMGATGATGRPMGLTFCAGVVLALFELGRRPAHGGRRTGEGHVKWATRMTSTGGAGTGWECQMAQVAQPVVQMRELERQKAS